MRLVLRICPATVGSIVARGGLRIGGATVLWDVLCGSYAQRSYPPEIIWCWVKNLFIARSENRIMNKARRKGVQFLSVFFIVCGVFAFYWLKNWYTAHPVWGNIALVALGLFLLWQFVRLIQAFNDDPLTRTAPYKRD